MENVSKELVGQVAIVRLDNPPLNLLTRQMIHDLHDTFAALADDRSVNAVVLSATGDRAFCAGLDLRERRAEVVASDPPEGEPVHALLDRGKLWRETQWLVRHCPCPVVAAVEGIAIGGGFGLIGVCDIIFASERATFQLNEINVGLLGGASKALRMLGPYKARSMFFLGKPVPASEFYRLGAIEEVTPPGQAEERALEFATLLAAKSPIGLRLAKESIARIEDMSLEDAYRTEQDYTNRLREFNDSAEAMQAFMEKRPPQWTWS